VSAADQAFLFTDLAGSSRLWERQPDAMQVALADHDAIVAAAVQAHGGEVFSTMGDGFAATFADVGDAVAAAVDAQRNLRGYSWGPTGELRVRMGIHIGPAQRRGTDYFGPTLNRCARLMALGHGGQVLVSAAARDRLGADHQTHDLGYHQLRDLAAPEHVFQLVADGMDVDFPPLRGVEGSAGNLPLQLTSFVGRRDDVDGVLAALESGRVLTLSGVGGVGKTRLALQAAAAVASQFADGVWLCELAALGDPDAVPHVVAALFGVQAEPDRSLTGLLAERLRTSKTLLVLDNCEHVLDAVVELVEAVLAACPGVTVLATSREPLVVAGEIVRPVRALGSDDALELFVDRASAARPEFTLNDGNEAAVAEICRRLDGVPLAIELAAARVLSMGPTEIAQRLDERFRLLTGGRRTALERQRTLRGTVDWSYDLLDAAEQTVFCRLAVFAGGFTIDAAEAVAGTDDSGSVADAVWSLVRKSMLVADVQEESTRYTMLETLRQYAEEQLVGRGEADDIRRAHSSYLAALAEQAREGERRPEEGTWARRLDLELANFRAALSWAADHDRPETAGRLIAALGLHAYMYMWSEFDTWATTVAAAIDRAGEHVTPSTAIFTYAIAADFAWAAGESRRAQELIDRGSARVDEKAIGISIDPDAVVELETARSNVCLATGDAAGAIEAIEQGVAVAHRSAPAMLARSQAHLALALAAANRTAEARTTAEAALALARTTGNPTTIGYSGFALGESLLDSDVDAAVGALAEADLAVRSVNNRFLVGICQLSLVSALGRSSTPEPAFSGYLELLDHWEAAANRLQQRVTIRNAAELLSRRGQPDVAAVVHGSMDALGSAPPAGSPEQLRLAASLAAAQHALGPRYDDAVRCGASMDDDELVEFVRHALQQALEPPA
jgi:predicted ATPase/class 3 adenylate cyclase